MDHESPKHARYSCKESGPNNFISVTVIVSSPLLHKVSISYSVCFAWQMKPFATKAIEVCTGECCTSWKVNT